MRRLISTLQFSQWSLLSMLVIAGCGSSPPPVETSLSEATVKGVVKVMGSPMTSGRITFNPSNYKRADVGTGSAETQPDGHYEVKTLVGQNSISVYGPEIKKHPELGYAAQTLIVKDGENNFNMILPPPKQGESPRTLKRR